MELTRAEKIKKSNVAFADTLEGLQNLGKLVFINRVAKKNYNVIINAEIMRNYKQRRSAKKYLTRLLNNLNNLNN